ncbi:hypothetical protein D3C76_778830 [compost metagenome]
MDDVLSVIKKVRSIFPLLVSLVSTLNISPVKATIPNSSFTLFIGIDSSTIALPIIIFSLSIFTSLLP